MKKLILSVIALSLGVAACGSKDNSSGLFSGSGRGGSGSGQGSTYSGSLGSCDDSTVNGFCVDFSYNTTPTSSDPSYSAKSQVQSTCSSYGGTYYYTLKCSSVSTVGYCSLKSTDSSGLTIKSVRVYYSPTYTYASAQTDCYGRSASASFSSTYPY